MRRCALPLLTLALLTLPFTGLAQEAGKVYRIGILATTPRTTPGARLLEAFLQGLRELGYVEGQNIVVEGRYSEGRDERLPELAAELVRLNVDVIVAGATQPVHAAARATTTIPIVMPNHSDPVGSGLVSSLARPGGNITGLSILNPELVGKQLELLREAVPRVARVAVLWNPTHQAHPSMLSEADRAARALGVRLQRLPVQSQADYEGSFAAMTRERADAVLVLGDQTFWFHRERIAELAARSRLPAVFVQREHAEAGGLMAYGADLRDNYRRAATYVAKILKGAKPGDLPIEQPTKFVMVINLRAAKVLGLTIPQSVLMRADEIIQ
jgi:putative ABC transport system substrate-binding protein